MKYFSSSARFITILLLGSSIASCSLVDQSDKIIGPNWEPSFAAPLLNTKFSMTDILEGLDSTSFIQTDAQGLLTIVYEDEFFAQNDGPLFDLPDVLVPMFDTTQQVGFPVEGISGLSIKQGILNYSFESLDLGAHELIVEIPEASQNEVTYKKTINFSAPGTFAGRLDLSGYDLDIEQGKMTFAYFARPVGTTERNRLTNFYFEISDLEYQKAYGYLGTQSIELGSDSISFDMFDKMSSGEFYLNDPRISLRIDNTYGVPMEIKAENFSVLTDNGPIALTHSGLENGILVNYPELGQEGSAATTVIDVHKDNSNLPELFSVRPSGLSYDFKATLHPEGDSTQTGFVLDNSGFDFGLTIQIPLDLQLRDIRFEQDLGLEMGNIESVESAELTLITENGFPLELVLQAYFLDDQGVVQDSLFDGPSQLLTGAAVDQNGRVFKSATNNTDIELSPMRWYHLQNSAEIRVKAEIATSNQGTVPVKFYDDYTLDIKLGIKAFLNS